MGKDILVLLITAIWGLSACTGVGSAGAPPTVKIGLVAPFEGLHRPLGYEALFGVKLALQERNRAGGVGGYQVELVALNDFDEPGEARTQAQVLAADPEVVGVVGHLTSVTTAAALPVYQQANLAVVVPWSVAAAVESDSSGWVSVAAPLAETEARLQMMGRDLGFEQFTSLNSSTFDSLPPDTEALWLDTDGVTAGEIIKTLHQANRALPVFGGVDVGSPQLLQTADEAAAGLIFVSPGPDPRQVAEASAFLAAYEALAGFSPGPRALLAYDATHVLLRAIEQSLAHQPPARAEIRAALSGVAHEGLSGPIRFDRQGQRIEAPVWVYQIVVDAYPGVLISP